MSANLPPDDAAAAASAVQPRSDSRGNPRVWGLVLGGLGLLRVTPLVIEWFRRAAAWTNGRLPAPGDWSSLARATELGDVAWRLWPLLLGGLLIVRPTRRLRVAVLLTALAMIVEDLAQIGLFVGLGVRPDRVLLVPGGTPVFLRVGLRGLFVALEFAILQDAWWAGWLERPQDGRGTRTRGRPEAIAGRLMGLVALIFVGLAGTSVTWSVYEQVVQRSPRLRNLLAGSIGSALPTPPPRPLSPAERAVYEVSDRIDAGLNASARGELDAAATAYRSAIRGLEAIESSGESFRNFDARKALVHNNLAWLLVTRPDEARRNPAAALPLARLAVQLAPDEGNYWNTLGVVQFRLGDRAAASQAFERSTSLRDGGDGFDWFFQAMIAHDRGEPEQAAALYDRAVVWRTEERERDEEVARFHAEAARHLGRPEPEPLKPRDGPGSSSRPGGSPRVLIPGRPALR